MSKVSELNSQLRNGIIYGTVHTYKPHDRYDKHRRKYTELMKQTQVISEEKLPELFVLLTRL